MIKIKSHQCLDMLRKYFHFGNLPRFSVNKSQKLIITQHKFIYQWKYLAVVPCVIFLGVIFSNSPTLFVSLLMSVLMVTLIQQFGKKAGLPYQWLLLIQFLAVVGIFSGFWLDYFADPAQAQFFKKAEDFFQNNLTQGSSTNENTRSAISLVFNVLRAIYLLYIAGSLIGVINAVRKDEEWQSVAKTPLLVVLAVTIADVLTSYIVGDTSTK